MEETTTVKKTTRTRKTIPVTSPAAATGSSPKNLNLVEEAFTLLLGKINEVRNEFEALQKEIALTKDGWLREQKQHEQDLQREEETYRYEMVLTHKKSEDEFAERKARWEKELAEKKEEIEADKKELNQLREKVAGFETELGKATKEANDVLQKELNERFQNEKKLREQQVAAEKNILSLRIESLTKENNRQTREIETLKAALEETTRQIKEIAVKVIETGGNIKSLPPENPSH